MSIVPNFKKRRGAIRHDGKGVIYIICSYENKMMEKFTENTRYMKSSK